MKYRSLENVDSEFTAVDDVVSFSTSTCSSDSTRSSAPGNVRNRGQENAEVRGSGSWRESTSTHIHTWKCRSRLTTGTTKRSGNPGMSSKSSGARVAMAERTNLPRVAGRKRGRAETNHESAALPKAVKTDTCGYAHGAICRLRLHNFL